MPPTLARVDSHEEEGVEELVPSSHRGPAGACVARCSQIVDSPEEEDEEDEECNSQGEDEEMPAEPGAVSSRRLDEWRREDRHGVRILGTQTSMNNGAQGQHIGIATKSSPSTAAPDRNGEGRSGEGHHLAIATKASASTAVDRSGEGLDVGAGILKWLCWEDADSSTKDGDSGQGSSNEVASPSNGKLRKCCCGIGAEWAAGKGGADSTAHDATEETDEVLPALPPKQTPVLRGRALACPSSAPIAIGTNPPSGCPGRSHCSRVQGARPIASKTIQPAVAQGQTLRWLEY